MTDDESRHQKAPAHGDAQSGAASRAGMLSRVREAALVINSGLSLDDVLQKTVHAARELVQARYAALGVARRDLKGLERFVVEGVTSEQIEAIGDWPRGLGLLGTLLREPRPLRVPVIANDPRSVGFPPHHPPMTSFLGVPIMLQGRILGNFYLTEKIGAPEFSQDDEDILVLFASHAALAIDNARLFTQTNRELRQKMLDLDRSEKRATFLAELALILPGRPVAEEVPVELVAQRATGVLGDACCIYLVEGSYPQRIRRRVAYHRDPARAAAAMGILDGAWETLAEEVVGKGRAIVLRDISLPLATVPGLEPEVIKGGRFNAIMALPMRTGRGPYGVFATLASQPSTFRQDDYEFASLVAERLAVSMENSMLLAELASAVEARDEFISVATHELKTPVAVLKGFAQALLRFGKTDPALERRALGAIDRQVDRLAALTDELLDVARLRAGRMQPRRERLDLVRLVQEVVRRFDLQLAEQEHPRLVVESEMPELWGVWDASRLDQVVTNLVSNALKYSPKADEVKIVIWRQEGEALLTVEDHGIGIPRDQQRRIFEPFFRAENARAVGTEGTGLGLHLSRQIVERLGGHMWFESEEGKGTKFYFSLPLADGSPAEPTRQDETG